MSTKLTVGYLKSIINDLPDHAEVLVERVEDFYFDRDFCKTEKFRNERYYKALKWNKEMLEEIELRRKGEEPEYPLMIIPEKLIVTEEELDSNSGYYDEYVLAFSAHTERDKVYIKVHY